MITTRVSRRPDEQALRRLDVATWSPAVTPAPRPADDEAFFTDRRDPEDVLVACAEEQVVGYVALQQRSPLAAHAHVQEINGLAVDPAWQRRGVGTSLVEAALAEAERRGLRKVGLRVLESNPAARRLYERCGFVVEGVLVDEFWLGGEHVDDVLMARREVTEAASRPRR